MTFLFLISFLFFGGCTTVYKSGAAATESHLTESAHYLQVLHKRTREVKLYTHFNTAVVAHVTRLDDTYLKAYEDRQRVVFKSTLKKQSAVHALHKTRPDPVFNGRLEAGKVMFLVSLYVPRPLEHFAERFAAHWEGIISGKTSTTQPEDLRVFAIRDVRKTQVKRYFPYVTKWSHEFLIRVDQANSQEALQLTLTSELGRLQFGSL